MRCVLASRRRSAGRPAPVMERVTLRRGGARALAKNPTVAQAATAIASRGRTCCSRRAPRRGRRQRGPQQRIARQRARVRRTSRPAADPDALSANVQRAGPGGVALGRRDAGARPDRDRAALGDRRPAGRSRRHRSGLPGHHRAAAAGRRQSCARARPRRRTWTTRSGGWRAAPARG